MSLLSIVHEFAVLYSSRVLQKDKRWSDGRLRYYEHNNKIEVLSDDMMLVGTDFYPHHARKPMESGIFADGSEYILPSGNLLIEFNEYLGSFERDLSNVFTKKDVAVKKEPPIHSEVFRQEPPGVIFEKGKRIYIKHEDAIQIGSRSSDSLGNASLVRLQHTVGRPIGLRRRPIQVKKPHTLKSPISEKMIIRLDASFSSSAKVNRRIPPGSNRLMSRLLSETIFDQSDGKEFGKE